VVTTTTTTVVVTTKAKTIRITTLEQKHQLPQQQEQEPTPMK
jgi:hypothetical protein